MAGRFQLRGVEVRRSGRRVLGPIDLELEGPGPVVIAGPSGSGKSSLLRLLNGLDAPSAGAVAYAGRDLAQVDRTQHRRRVAMVFQQPVVLPGTVADNLREADPTLDDAGIADALGRVGLDPALAVRSARDLSGGEAQRMGLARSLATDPEVVLFDEPTSALDPANAGRIEALARTLASEGIGVVWVTHDLEQLHRVAREVIVVVDGLVAQAGPVDEVLGGPAPDVRRFLDGDLA